MIFRRGYSTFTGLLVLGFLVRRYLLVEGCHFRSEVGGLGYKSVLVCTAERSMTGTKPLSVLRILKPVSAGDRDIFIQFLMDFSLLCE